MCDPNDAAICQELVMMNNRSIVVTEKDNASKRRESCEKMVYDVGLGVGGCRSLEVEFGEVGKRCGDGDDVVEIEISLGDHGKGLKAGELGERGE